MPVSSDAQPPSGPLGLPMMISFSRLRRPGWSLIMVATALINTSGAFSGWILPTNKIT